MKRNTILKLFGCCICIFSILTCDRVTEEKIRSYIVEFYNCNAIWLELTKNDNIVMYWRDDTERVSYESKGKDAERYDALCEKYNDLNYYKKTRYIEYIGCREYSSNEIISA